MNIEAEIKKQPGRVIIPPGVHVLDKGILAAVLRDLEIIFEPNAHVRLAKGVKAEAFDLRGASEVKIRFVNPSIDVSDGVYGGGSTNSAIALSNFGGVFVDEPHLFGGQDFASRNGDSGISASNCGYIRISGGVIRGFRDTAIYPGGNNELGPAGDGGVCDIEGTHIYDCQHAVTAKRELTMCRIDRIHVENCVAGCIQSSVVNGHYVGPARRMHITNSTFKKVTANVCRFLSDGSGLFAGNTVEDWGRYLDTGRPAGHNAVAIAVMGSQGARIRGNDFLERDWRGGTRIALKITDYKDSDGKTRWGGGVLSHGNNYAFGEVVDRGTVPSRFSDL